MKQLFNVPLKAVTDVLPPGVPFVASLDDRQKQYYFNLGDSWYKSMVRLEKRVYDLEEKS